MHVTADYPVSPSKTRQMSREKMQRAVLFLYQKQDKHQLKEPSTSKNFTFLHYNTIKWNNIDEIP